MIVRVVCISSKVLILNSTVNHTTSTVSDSVSALYLPHDQMHWWFSHSFAKSCVRRDSEISILRSLSSRLEFSISLLLFHSAHAIQPRSRQGMSCLLRYKCLPISTTAPDHSFSYVDRRAYQWLLFRNGNTRSQDQGHHYRHVTESACPSK